MRNFVLLWFGQVVSAIGSAMTGFTMSVWIYRETHSPTALSLAALSAALPALLAPPLAGTLVDLWDRRKTMILCDALAAVSTLMLILMLSSNRLELWHVCLANALTSAFSSVSRLAESGSVALLVPESQFGRANGLNEAGLSAVQILSPLFAGLLLGVAPVTTVLTIDLGTYLVALATLALVRIPRPEPVLAAPAARTPGRRAWLANLTHGWRYIAHHRALLVLCILFAVFNFIVASIGILLQPLVLSFSTATVLGSLYSLGGFGALAGSIVLIAWGGPKDRVQGLLGALLVSGLCIVLAGWRPSVPWIGTAMFVFYFATPLLFSSNQSLWQANVPPAEQGRVFGARTFLMSWSSPLGLLAAGRLAERVFEPLLAPGGPAADTIGRVIGVGSGRGIGLFFIVMGAIFVTLALGARWLPSIRSLGSRRPEAAAAQLA
ncbi:MAG TPA: MFS transporter [Thermoanaerobaculia bacterium]|nr:MFS transporter [Thermoanaerobaculia bacterium]